MLVVRIDVGWISIRRVVQMAGHVVAGSRIRLWDTRPRVEQGGMGRSRPRLGTDRNDVSGERQPR